MNNANDCALVSTQWLAEHLEAPDVRSVDATWFLPGSKRNAREEYYEGHIPGAVFFDIDEIADTDVNLPHMLPSPEKFSRCVTKLGLGDGVRIIVYDTNGGFMAAHRVWWMFRVFGHEDVAVLNGGLPKWLAEDRAVEDILPITKERNFTFRMNTFLVRSKNQILKNIDSEKEQIVDARNIERFTGSGKEPRANLRSGHIPKSYNLPFQCVIDTEHFNVMRSANEIVAIFEEHGIDLSKPIVASCGSGVTASCLVFALYLVGCKDVAVYDGSWVEWGSDDKLPVVIGE